MIPTCAICNGPADGMVVEFHHHSSTIVDAWFSCELHGEQWHEPHPLYGLRPSVYYRGVFNLKGVRNGTLPS